MTSNKKILHLLLSIVVFAAVILHSLNVSAEAIGVQAQVEKQEVTVGESFVLQIKIDGDASPAEPDLSGLQDFAVQPKGGGQNNRESITIINGRINRVSEHGYVFRYLLTPKRDGILTVPAIEIIAGGKTLLTQPVPIRVSKPITTDEFKLRVALSETESYVGQPLILTVKWYVNRDIAEFTFDLPFLEEQTFAFANLSEDDNYQGQDAIPLNLQGGTVVARKGREGLSGLQFATVTLRKILIPKESGEFALGRGSVLSKIITGYKQNRGNQPFSDFFNNGFGRKQAVYRQFVTESNDLHLKVVPLPEEKRPVDFTGLVGQYSLAAEANPTEVNVGDPITLNIRVTGAEYLDNVVLPVLSNQQGIKDAFKVPDEMAPGVIDGRVKIFTRTIRAMHPSVTEIPSIGLTYFNPETKKYESAETNAIPLQVNATKVVTAKDAEGAVSGVTQNELMSLNKGIAHNYVGEEILDSRDVEVNSWFTSPLGLALIIFPPGVYLLVLVPVYFRRKRLRGGGTLQAKKALTEFSRELVDLKKGIKRNELEQTVGSLVSAMRIYLGKRLHMVPGGLVYADVVDQLQQYGVDTVLLQELKEILDRCEAYRYGAFAQNGSDAENLQVIIENVSALFIKIDQCIEK